MGSVMSCTYSSVCRVPRPTICPNFTFERTTLKNTRFTHSGTSMPACSLKGVVIAFTSDCRRAFASGS